MLADGCFDPVAEMGESVDGFEIDHQPLKALGKSLEELLTDHGFVYVVFSHSDYMFEVRHIFVDVPSFHFEGENVSSGKILAHMILECFGEVIDDRSPDPFVCVSSSESNMFCD